MNVSRGERACSATLDFLGFEGNESLFKEGPLMYSMFRGYFCCKRVCVCGSISFSAIVVHHSNR